MHKRLLSILQYVLFLGAGIFLVWWQFNAMSANEKNEFYNALRGANYWLLIPIILMSLASHLSRSMRWKLLMEPLGYKPLLSNVFAVTLIGYLINAAVPRLGEIAKCSFLARYEKLKVDKIVGTIIVERTFDLFCYVIFIGITVLIQIDVIGDVVKSKLKLISGSGGFPLWAKLLILIAVIAGIMYLIKFLIRKFPYNRFIIKINNFEKGLIEGFKSIRNLKHRKAFLLHTLFIWSMYLLQIYVGFYAMEGTMHLSIKAAFSVLTLATLAMIATPNGIGTFPIFVMQTLLIYNIAAPLGQAFGSLIWGVSTSIILCAGGISTILLPLINRKKHEGSTINTRENFQP